MTRLGFMPQNDDDLLIRFEYDIINSNFIDEKILTSDQAKDIIIAVIKDYLNLENEVGKN